jgi:hypothetical protein
MTHSDHYLFLTDTQSRLRAYAFGADGRSGMPVLVREFADLKSPRGMAFHRATGTLLVACAVAAEGVRLLDTRPPPAQWQFHADDRQLLQAPRDRSQRGVARRRVELIPPISLAIDQANDNPYGFVYAATFDRIENGRSGHIPRWRTASLVMTN